MRRIIYTIVIWIASLFIAYFYGIKEQQRVSAVTQAELKQTLSRHLLRQIRQHTEALCVFQTKEEKNLENLIREKPTCKQLLDTDISDCLPQ